MSSCQYNSDGNKSNGNGFPEVIIYKLRFDTRPIRFSSRYERIVYIFVRRIKYFEIKIARTKILVTFLARMFRTVLFIFDTDFFVDFVCEPLFARPVTTTTIIITTTTRRFRKRRRGTIIHRVKRAVVKPETPLDPVVHGAPRGQRRTGSAECVLQIIFCSSACFEVSGARTQQDVYTRGG